MHDSTARNDNPELNRLCAVFQRTFTSNYRTLLQGGAEEPLYLPERRGEPATILFTRDYFASALHEVAHWCIAGTERRKQTDYGYWYAPDGRSAQQQALFEKVEVKPQALEWMFSRAAGVGFRVSADNLDTGLGPSEGFKRAVWRQVQQYCEQGLPCRARAFVEALANEYGTTAALNADSYQLEVLN